MKKLLFGFILLLVSSILFASDGGAAGSGKPVAVKMRKDYLENVIKQYIKDTVEEHNHIKYDKDIEKYGKISIDSKLGIKISDVLFSRGLLAEGASPFGSETASRYRVIVLGSLEIASIESFKIVCEDTAKDCINHTFSNAERKSLAKYYNKILDSYRYNLTDFDMESDQYDYSKIKEHPNFMLKGYFMPKEDGDGKLDESIYVFKSEYFNMHIWQAKNKVKKSNDDDESSDGDESKTLVMNEILKGILEELGEIEVNISTLSKALEDKNPFLKISKPNIFETDATMIAMDYCDEDNPGDCITYPVSETPESSFSNNKAGNLIEFRISEEVFRKEVLKSLELEVEKENKFWINTEVDHDFFTVQVFDDHLLISYALSTWIIGIFHCNTDLSYEYKFTPSMENYDEKKIQLTLSHSDKSYSNSFSIIAAVACKVVMEKADSAFKKSTKVINEKLLEHKSTLKKLALNDINLEDINLEDINLEDINLEGLNLGGINLKDITWGDIIGYIESNGISLEGALKSISKYVSELKDILTNYKIKAGFETGSNYKDIVFSVTKKAPEKDNYLANFNWAYSDSNHNSILNFADPCWYSDGKESCDLDGDGIQDHVDDKVFKAESKITHSERDGISIGEKTCKTTKTGLFYTTVCGQDKEAHYGEHFDINGTLYMKDLKVYESADKYTPKTYLSSYYCYCGESERVHGQCDVTSTCGEHHGNPGKVTNEEFANKNTWQPMYTMYNQNRNNKLYKKETNDKKISKNTGIYATRTSGKWFWQRDLEDVYGISNLPEWDVQNIIQCKEGIVANEKECHTEYYKDFNAARVSFAPSREESNSGSSYVTTLKRINSKYFENYFVFEDENDELFNAFGSNFTKHNWALSSPSYFELIKWKDIVTEYEYRSMDGSWLYYPYERMNDFINPWLIDLTGPVENPGMPMPEASRHVYDTILTPDALFLKKVEHGANTQQVFTFDNSYMYYSFEEESFFITPSLYSVSRKDKKEVVNGISLNAGSFVSYNGAIFAAGNLVNNTIAKKTAKSSNVLNDDYVYENVFVKISENDKNFELNRLAEIPGFYSLTLKLFVADGKLNAATLTYSGELLFFEYDFEKNHWYGKGGFDCSGEKVPLISSLTAVENNVLFAVLEPEGTFLYEFNAESGVREVIQISYEQIPFTKIATFKDEVIIADMSKMKEGTVGIYSLKDGILDFNATEPKTTDFALPDYGAFMKAKNQY